MLSFMLICLILGAVVGILAGLLGIGGGLIIVPALLYLLPMEGITKDIVMPMSIATSLATIIITSASAAWAHYKKGNIDFSLTIKLMKSIIIGALMGSFLADILSFNSLSFFFASVVVLLALQMIFSFNFESSKTLPSTLGIYVIGFITGTIASLMGIGGGAILVPILTYYALPIRHAMGIASACGVCVALFGSLGFVVTGYQQENLPQWSLGYIYLPALLAMVITSFVCAPLGVKLAHALPVKQLKKCFALFLLFVAVKMFSEILVTA